MKLKYLLVTCLVVVGLGISGVFAIWLIAGDHQKLGPRRAYRAPLPLPHDEQKKQKALDQFELLLKDRIKPSPQEIERIVQDAFPVGDLASKYQHVFGTSDKAIPLDKDKRYRPAEMVYRWEGFDAKGFGADSVTIDVYVGGKPTKIIDAEVAQWSR